MTDRDPARGERLKDLVARAIAMPREERGDFIAHECDGDVKLALEVRDMVSAHEAAGSFMSSPTHAAARAPADATTQAGSPHEGPGTRIGPYKLLELIGEGGFGSVYLAEQREPIARRVALKIIKSGMDSRMVAARFEAERQALALMDHPHIARVFDGGVTDASLGSRPFFVMEYVKGDPITDFADAHKLSVGERLALFAQVCQAVQHAHTKGVIHRDLKPSNVLVSMTDGKPFAKVIDFGIAKSLASRLTEKTLFTEHRQLVGTPEYMSPEQAEGSPDIDTRTDVYALGVLLYELLTGATPFDATRLRSAAFVEMQRIIREEEPPTPSVRLTRDVKTLASTAAARRVDPGKLGTQIKGELDWIVMKALDKDRARRYESPNQLAADVERHLAGEAVVAAPISLGYRARKFVRRNRGAVLAGTAIGASLVLGIVGTVLFARNADLQRRAALDAREAEAEQRSIAEERAQQLLKERDRFERLATMTDLYAGASSELADEEEAEWPQYYELLKRLNEGALADAPAVELAFRTGLGRVLAYNDDGEAFEVFEPAIAIAEKLEPSNLTTRRLEAMGDICYYNEDYEQADRYYELAVGQARRARPDSLDVLRALNNLLYAKVELASAADGPDEKAQAALREADDRAQTVFRETLAMARRLSNPVIQADVLSLLKEYFAHLAARGGVFESVGSLLDELDPAPDGSVYDVWLQTLAREGAMWYRAGRYEHACARLERADKLRRAQPAAPMGRPVTAAYLALAQHRCGNADGARTALQRLVQLAESEQHREDVEVAGLVREARELIEGVAAPTPKQPN